jgi:hypothetical protein
MAEPETHYISSSDITDKQLLSTSLTAELTAKIALCDDALEDMTERKDVDADEIETSPLHFSVKMWCVYWVCWQLCSDLIGSNKLQSIEQDVYFQKAREYEKKLKDIELTITVEMLTGTVADKSGRSSNTTRIYRG